MPLLKAQADKLSEDDMVRGVIEEIYERDDLFQFLPFVKTTGKAYVYNREESLSAPTFKPVSATVDEGAGTFDQITTTLKILIGDVDVDKFLDEVESDLNEQKAIQIAMKAKAMGQAFRKTLVQGDEGTNADEFDGIEALLDAAVAKTHGTNQRISAGTNGAALTLDMLDELLDAIPMGADVLMMRRSTYRAVKTLLRAAGGNTGGMLQVENYGLVPQHDGVPIILNDYIQTDLTEGTNAATTAIYALRLNEVDGLHGLYGGSAAGVRMEDIGTVQNKDSSRTRLKWYCGLALKSTQSLASLNGITNV